MNPRWMLVLVLAPALAAACGSSGPKGSDLGGPPPGARGLPSIETEDIVVVEAHYDPRAFGGMLREGCLAVHLTAQLKGAGQETAQIVAETDRMRLFLQDGTALVALSPSEAAQRTRDKRQRPEVEQRAFRDRLLKEEPYSGYVYFGLGGSFRADGSLLQHTQNGFTKTLDPEGSLLAIDLKVDGSSTRPLFVGIER